MYVRGEGVINGAEGEGRGNEQVWDEIRKGAYGRHDGDVGRGEVGARRHEAVTRRDETVLRHMSPSAAFGLGREGRREKRTVERCS